MNPRTFLLAFLVSTLGAAAAVAFIANSRSGFIPMLAGHDFIRDEFVLRHAAAEEPSPCIAFYGDSRVAFNISGEIVDRAMPSDCKSQNYGFPALTLDQLDRLVSEIPARRAAVVSVSESMLFLPRTTWLERKWERFVARTLQNRMLRWIYLGHQRAVELMRSIRSKPTLDSGWSWSTTQKRWSYSGLGERQLIALPSYEQEADAMADSYFGKNRVGQEKQLREFLANASRGRYRLFVVIPPSESLFQDRSERYTAGEQRTAWQIIARAAHDAGATLLDCSRNCVPESGFGDPVHLNDRGMTEYSNRLARAIVSTNNAVNGRD